MSAAGAGQPAAPGQAAALLLLMLASGFAGLGYQIVWTQQSAVWLGHEAAAVLAVVAAFFGGLALGALALGTRIERSDRPARWYAGCELVIALWSLALLLLMPPFGRAMLLLTGVTPSPLWQWTLAFAGSLLLLLPATAAMGATLPAVARVAAQLGGLAGGLATARQAEPPHAGGQSVALLYAANTLGAVLGVLASAFWLVPAFGLSRTAALCIALNLLCAAVALWALPGRMQADGAAAVSATQGATAAAASGQPMRAAAPAPSANGRAALARLAATGLLGIGYEVLVVRVLSQVSEDTVYTFAMLLAVYLVGTSLGAALWQRWRAADAGLTDEQATDRLLGTLAAACLLGTASLWGAEWLKAGLLEWLGSSLASGISAEAVLALAAFGLPTLVMGALFSQLSAQAAAHGLGLGRALGVNTLGAALAPLLFGVLLLPALGPKACLLLVAAGYLALTRWCSWRWPATSAAAPTGTGLAAASGRGLAGALPFTWLPAAALLALALWAPPLLFAELPEGGQLVSYQDGVMAAVSVSEDADGVRRLRINNRQQEGSSSSALVDGRQALLPLLLHPAPRHVLFLGLGTGVTAATAAQDATLQVEAVELLPEVIAAARYFSELRTDGAPQAAAGPAPRLHAIAADARRYVLASQQRYDVIVSDNFHPARSGSGALYTVEHFQAVRGRLADGGLFCQWLPLHQMDLVTLRSIVRSFTLAFPGARAMLASNSLSTPVLGLVGQADTLAQSGQAAAPGWDPAQLQQRLARNALARPLAAYGLDDEWALLGSFVGGPAALAAFAADAVANTDDHTVVAYLAPRITYAPDSLPQQRLQALLQALRIAPGDVLQPGHDADAVRLAAYWSARDGFINAGLAVRPSADLRDMLAQVQQPLLAVLQRSPDFRPAYDPLLRMAEQLGRSDAPAARALLSALLAAQPARPEAAAALQRLAP